MYDLFIEREAHEQRKLLPGNMRQRIAHLIADLGSHPRPALSESLETGGLPVPEAVELRRIRLEHWRIVYAVNDDESWVWIWRIRRRPPYDYDDLMDFIDQM